MTIQTPATRLTLRLSVAFILCLAAAPASAQVTHTMVPKRDPLLNQDGSFKWPVGLHVFGGLSVWELGYTPIEFDTTQGRNGFLVATDFGARVSDSVTIGAGGWYNGTSEYSVDGWSTPTARLSDIEYRFKRRMYSVYGSAFWKVIGVQGGIVPTSVSQTRIVKATGASTSNGDGSQLDADLFAVLRLGASEEDDSPKVSAAVGYGVHRYGARDAGAGLGAPASSPSSMVQTMFGNFSFHVFRRLSVDVTYWLTDSDDAGGVNGVGNPGGKRGSLGIGYTF